VFNSRTKHPSRATAPGMHLLRLMHIVHFGFAVNYLVQETNTLGTRRSWSDGVGCLVR
jgi:hypothetical protein